MNLCIRKFQMSTLRSGGGGWGEGNSSVGIATYYGPHGPGIESRWGARFSAPVQTGIGTHPASCAIGTGSFPGVKRPGRGVDLSPPSSAVIKERVELYICSPSGSSWPVKGRTLPFTLRCGRCGVWIPAGATGFSLFQNVQTGCRAQ